MARANTEKKIEDGQASTLANVGLYARTLWLDVSAAKGRVGAQIGRIESAFDHRVANALNRIGIPSKHDVDTLSAKLDELMVLLERVGPKRLERSESGQ